MAKRYHNSKKADVGPDLYSGASARYALERKDAGMIHEDHSAIANLPQEVMIKDWPMKPGYLNADLDDGISGIDSQLRAEASGLSKGYKPRKI